MDHKVSSRFSPLRISCLIYIVLSGIRQLEFLEYFSILYSIHQFIDVPFLSEKCLNYYCSHILTFQNKIKNINNIFKYKILNYINCIHARKIVFEFEPKFKLTLKRAFYVLNTHI